MRGNRLAFLLIALPAVAAAGQAPRPTAADTIIALERAALDRWGKGDPQGYIETYAPEITYFDPFAEKRVDGITAMRAYLAPITGKIKVRSFDMVGPRVQRSGDVAVLTYNLVSHTNKPTGEPTDVRWNSTAVYRLVSGRWKMIHSHWSFTKSGPPGISG